MPETKSYVVLYEFGEQVIGFPGACNLCRTNYLSQDEFELSAQLNADPFKVNVSNSFPTWEIVSTYQ